MTTDTFEHDQAFDQLVTRIADEMVEVRFNRGVAFISLPLVYPDGSFVTVSIRRGMTNYSVSDNGFAYRELEAVGRERSFSRIANSFSEEGDLFVSRRAVAASADEDTLSRAIWDVAAASYQTVYHGYQAVQDADEASIEDEVRERIADIFSDAVAAETKITGASTAQWDVTAIIRVPDEASITVFQAVPNFAQSVYRTNALFGDLMALDNPPNVVSVVRHKAEFGPKLNILNRAGRIIELQAAPERYRKAAHQ